MAATVMRPRHMSMTVSTQPKAAPPAPSRVPKHLLCMTKLHESYMGIEEPQLRASLGALPSDVQDSASKVFFNNTTNIKSSGGWTCFAIVPASRLVFSETTQAISLPLDFQDNIRRRHETEMHAFPTLAFLQDEAVASRIIFPNTAPGAFTAGSWAAVVASDKLVVLAGLVTAVPFHSSEMLSTMKIGVTKKMTVVNALTMKCSDLLTCAPTPLQIASSIIGQMH